MRVPACFDFSGKVDCSEQFVARSHNMYIRFTYDYNCIYIHIIYVYSR